MFCVKLLWLSEDVNAFYLVEFLKAKDASCLISSTVVAVATSNSSSSLKSSIVIYFIVLVMLVNLMPEREYYQAESKFLPRALFYPRI